MPFLNGFRPFKTPNLVHIYCSSGWNRALLHTAICRPISLSSELKRAQQAAARESASRQSVLCAHRHYGTSKQVMGTEPFQSAEMKLALEGNLISCLKFRRGPHHEPLPGSGPTLERVQKNTWEKLSCEFLINKTTAKIEDVWETEDRLTFICTKKLK